MKKLLLYVAACLSFGVASKEINIAEAVYKKEFCKEVYLSAESIMTKRQNSLTIIKMLDKTTLPDAIEIMSYNDLLLAAYREPKHPINSQKGKDLIQSFAERKFMACLDRRESLIKLIKSWNKNERNKIGA